MGLGDWHRESGVTFGDPVTGRMVTRLTDLATHCHHPYFYCRCFTPDSRRLLYCSHRSGKACLYLLDLESYASRQLTDCDELSGFLVNVSPDGRHVYYTAGDTLYRLSIEDLATEAVYTQSRPWVGRENVYPGFSSDFRQVLLAEMHVDDIYEGVSGWDFFAKQCELKPRSRLVLLDLETGAHRVVHEDACWLGHPQIRPGNPGTLMFCHEGPHYLLDARIWLIDADGSNRRTIGYRQEGGAAGAGPIVTHEYFTPDGRHISFTHFPEIYGKGGTIRLMEVDRLVETNLGPVHNYSHFYHSEDCRFIVGDQVGQEDGVPNGIWLFDVERRSEERLCIHGSSFAPRGRSTQDAHPHPTFSPDGKHVVFTSDRETSSTGPCSIYLTTTGIQQEIA